MGISINIEPPDQNPSLVFHPSVGFEAASYPIIHTNMEASLMTCLLK
jgi:hypothetical protein